MGYRRVFFSVVAVLSLSLCCSAQQARERDPRALAVLEESLVAMGRAVPSDSSATGIVTIVEGSTSDSGTIQILTRGSNQTAETINLSNGRRAVIYSNGEAREVHGTQSTVAVMELSVTDQCPDFPLPLLLSALKDLDEAFEYVGQDSLDGVSVQHVRVWDTFASDPRLQKLASFSAKDIWFDSRSGLPVKLAYSRRAGQGAVPSFAVEVFFSNYTSAGGVLYPFEVKKSYNGTPWETITIQSVTFNTGLTDAQFQVE
jgi:outer membrane lipoprotein-sorting protein